MRSLATKTMQEASPFLGQLNFKDIRDRRAEYEQSLEQRKLAGSVSFQSVIDKYEALTRLEDEWSKTNRDRNLCADRLAKEGKTMDANARKALVADGKRLKELGLALEERKRVATAALNAEASLIPNLISPAAPVGPEAAARVHKTVGTPAQFDFKPRDHEQIGAKWGLFDFESGAAVSGAKFTYLKNDAVWLELALVNWAMSRVAARGFTPVLTPDVARTSVVAACGFQPRGETSQVYSIREARLQPTDEAADATADKCMIGTAEIPLAGMYMDKIHDSQALPSRRVGFSHCFRAETGHSSAHSRGLYRLHQFSKVEMFAVTPAEHSDAMLEELLGIVEEMYTELGITFRLLDMPTEELGAPAYRKFDLEAWLPGRGAWGELCSLSNCTDYQSRRLGIRHRPAHSPIAFKPQYAHTLNGTACAIPRTIIAILETHQLEDGRVRVPDALVPFMHGKRVIGV